MLKPGVLQVDARNPVTLPAGSQQQLLGAAAMAQGVLQVLTGFRISHQPFQFRPAHALGSSSPHVGVRRGLEPGSAEHIAALRFIQPLGRCSSYPVLEHGPVGAGTATRTMHWTKVRRAFMQKKHNSERKPQNQTYLTYEEMLEIAAAREKEAAEDLLPSTVEHSTLGDSSPPDIAE